MNSSGNTDVKLYIKMIKQCWQKSEDIKFMFIEKVSSLSKTRVNVTKKSMQNSLWISGNIQNSM